VTRTAVITASTVRGRPTTKPPTRLAIDGRRRNGEPDTPPGNTRHQIDISAGTVTNVCAASMTRPMVRTRPSSASGGKRANASASVPVLVVSTQNSTLLPVVRNVPVTACSKSPPRRRSSGIRVKR